MIVEAMNAMYSALDRAMPGVGFAPQPSPAQLAAARTETAVEDAAKAVGRQKYSGWAVALGEALTVCDELAVLIARNDPDFRCDDFSDAISAARQTLEGYANG